MVITLDTLEIILESLKEYFYLSKVFKVVTVIGSSYI